VITLFSAPNYCDSYKNKAAIMKYENNVINIRQFNYTTPPYYLPGFMNVFTWSLPFAAEKIEEILLVLKKLVDDQEEQIVEIKKQRHEIVKAKIQTISKVYAIYQKMRKQREISMQMGHLLNNQNMLNLSREAIQKSKETYEGTKALDAPNEANPPIKKNYIDLSDSNPNRVLRRKVSLEQILKETPPQPPPTIRTDDPNENKNNNNL